MNILFYTWHEFTYQDGYDAFVAMGHNVTRIYYEWKNLAGDETFERLLLDELAKTRDGSDGSDAGARGDFGTKPFYDFVFSFNFFPVVSIACNKTNTPYISLVFDSPFLPLTSIQIHNPCNYIYTFDRKQAERMRTEGCERIFYSPLGVNAERLKEQAEPYYAEPWLHDISFLGQLYSGYDFYDQIDGHTTLPGYLKGWMDGVIAAQEHVFGFDLIGDADVVSPEKIREFHGYVDFAMTDNFRIDEDEVLRDVLRRKVSKVERPKLLSMLAKYFPVDLYTIPKETAPEGVKKHGYADYRTEMPHIFNRSKINLNITMRTIISGIPLRVLDVMAAGGFLITTYQEEVAAQFADGEELVIAYSPEDLLEKCAYYLAHEEEREAIARRGREKVLESYDYQTIINNILRHQFF